MEKSTGIKISSVFLTALALLNFRAAVAGTVSCPYEGYQACLNYCQEKGEKVVSRQSGVTYYSCQNNIDGAPAPTANQKQVWQTQKVRAARSPIVQNLLRTNNREDFITNLKNAEKNAEKTGEIVVTENTYNQLKARFPKFYMTPPKANLVTINGQRSAVISKDEIRVSLASAYSRSNTERKEER
ncbi:MAG: hypothetical protein K0S08_1990 [Gammaproteobacteria bacterium]|nr:hypothetical protein [Gammaproteobacteria bacterium]MCE3238241.1 hypothetical protein [Gammaproteobacteria bacterium]